MARKLRIYGYDAEYMRDADDTDLISESGKQSRILLTSDKRLAEESVRKGVSCVFVSGRTDLERLCLVFNKLRLRPVLSASKSRCPQCNAELRQCAKEDVSEYVAEESLRRYDSFFFCSFCGKAYWEGSHWSKLESFDSQLRDCLDN